MLGTAVTPFVSTESVKTAGTPKAGVGHSMTVELIVTAAVVVLMLG